MMLDKNHYLKTIKHAVCKDGIHEKTNDDLLAFKLDDEDGIALAVNFHSAMLNKVDYFLVDCKELNIHNIKLIELTDLKECIRKIENSISTANIERNTIQEEKKFIDSLWRDLQTEFIKKWSGSIAVIERFYRKTNESANTDLKYSLVIVCKNGTDVRLLDGLKNKLSGTMGTVTICNTDKLKDSLPK